MNISLEQAWAKVVPRWKSQALQQRLPIYRNWEQPAMDALRGTRLSGLSIFFLDERRSWLPGMALASDLDDLGLKTRAGAFGYRSVYDDAAQIQLMPIFRETDIAGGLSEAVPSETVQPGGHTAFISGLGYQTRWGLRLGLEGRLLTVPKNLDPHDAAAEAVRVVCHREWSRRDGAGYLGAELVFALVSPELGLDSSNLRTSNPLQVEIARSQTSSFVSQSLLAVVMAGQLLGEAFGNEQRTHFFDAMAQPSELQADTADLIDLENFFG